MGCASSSSVPGTPGPTNGRQQENGAQQQQIVQQNGDTAKTVANAGSYQTNTQLNYSEGTEEAVIREKPAVEQASGSFGDLRLGIKDDEEVRAEVEKLPSGELFCDRDFQADDTALTYEGKPQTGGGQLEWKRPKDLTDKPSLLVDDVCRNDIKQGALGDCWFLSSCAVIAQQPSLMKKVIPQNIKLFGSDYKGVVQFRFWRFGTWTTVYVDDLLPAKSNGLLYAHSEDANEYWVALIEKAYAKLHGSYQAIEGGQAMDALVDLTGGLAERYDIKAGSAPDPNLYMHLHRAANTGSFIATSKRGNWKESHVAESSTGLVSGHAYSITGVKKINTSKGMVELLRIRNPWGNDTEWTGAWSDNDSSWDTVDEETKNKIQFVNRGDGEFWMSFADFTEHFQEVTICTIGPDFDADGNADKPGCVRFIHGSWVPGESAGGCRNDMNAFATNPQFLLTLSEPDDFDEAEDDPSMKDKCSVVVTLMQEHRRSKKHLGVKMLQIGFCIYKTEKGDKRLPLDHFYYNYDCGTSGTYINYREVSARLNLDPGQYVIIPSTFNKGQQGSFMIRAFAQKSFEFSELGTGRQSEQVHG